MVKAAARSGSGRDGHRSRDGCPLATLSEESKPLARWNSRAGSRRRGKPRAEADSVANPSSILYLGPAEPARCGSSVVEHSLGKGPPYSASALTFLGLGSWISWFG